MSHRGRSGFTLIELMVAMVVGLAAVSAVYGLGAAMSEQFFREQRVAQSQATTRVAMLELRQDISRAGLFGTPNASLRAGDVGVERFQRTCDSVRPSLPQLNGGPLPMGAFQYYSGSDNDVVALNTTNTHAVGDRLRVLTSLHLTEQFLVSSTDIGGTTLVLDSGNQAFRRAFAWGQPAGPLPATEYLVGTLDWNNAWGGEAASWNGIGQRGARAFATGSVLHIETPEGRHFFRTSFGKGPNVQNQIRIQLRPALPVGTACLPGTAGGSTIAPLQWVEYAVIDPFDRGASGSDPQFLALDAVFAGSNLNTNTDFNDIEEGANRVLVRRLLDASDGTVRPNTTQVIAEYVTHFEVRFVLDRNSGSTRGNRPPDLVTSQDAGAINDNPENVRAVIVDLGVRSPLEDPEIDYIPPANDGDFPTRFEVHPNRQGAARVRRLRIEVPVMSVARRNLG